MKPENNAVKALAGRFRSKTTLRKKAKPFCEIEEPYGIAVNERRKIRTEKRRARRKSRKKGQAKGTKSHEGREFIPNLALGP